MDLFPNEELNFTHYSPDTDISSKDEINKKYIKGEIRIVTEQARYPLPSIVDMVESDNYELSPDFQRRYRWDRVKQSRLIESFIMNVPVPPVFLYEDHYSHYEVMDGIQRLNTIHEFYTDKFPLEGLEEWPELNGYRYSELPDQVKRGIDRRYLSSIILLRETAKTEEEAQWLKQIVFERINSGGVKLEYQESRNAIYNGPLNQLCIKLSRNQYLCRTWNIPEPDEHEISTGIESEELRENKHHQKMFDVELVLRFFAYRQRLNLQRGALKIYLDDFLRYGNKWPQDVFDNLEKLFTETIELVFDTFGETAFWLYRESNGSWKWRKQPSVLVYDPLMYVFSQHLDDRSLIIEKREEFKSDIEEFYKNNYDDFGGRSTNLSDIEKRNRLLDDFVENIIAGQ